MNELNKKLAEWAGFEKRELHNETIYGHAIETRWVHIQGFYDETEPPNFTDSLDDCFKWLAPKLKYANIQFSDQYSDVVPQFSATVSIQFADNHTWANDNPALALCKAIEKLIDDGNKT